MFFIFFMLRGFLVKLMSFDLNKKYIRSKKVDFGVFIGFFSVISGYGISIMFPNLPLDI